MISIINTHEWNIQCPCEQLSKSLNDKFALFSKDRFTLIVLDSEDSKSVGAIATFSFNSYMGAGLNKRIDISDSVKYDKDKKLIIFESNEDAFYMQHELNHFVHLCVDKGKFIHPNMKGKVFDTKSFRNGVENDTFVEGIKNWKKANEIEVGYRCLLDDINYKVPENLALIDRHIQKSNLLNMENWGNYFTKEQKKKYNAMGKDEKQKVLDVLCEQISITKNLPDEDTKFTVSL
jgi:hypothetical protein